jgi:methionyl aminopeptidase
MRKAGSITGQILREMVDLVKPGCTPLAIDSYAEKRCAELGAIPAFKGYRGFPKSVCISVNDDVVHGIPGSRPFQEGDLVKLDFGVIVDGYYGDAARTVPVGNISIENRCLINITKKALDAAIAVMLPGNRLGDISSAIQKIIEGSGFNVVPNLCGHAIGKALHEDPPVLNYGDADTGPFLFPGMVFAIEPISVLGDGTVSLSSDNWTFKTTDGRASAHFEDTIAITTNGTEVFTR